MLIPTSAGLNNTLWNEWISLHCVPLRVNKCEVGLAAVLYVKHCHIFYYYYFVPN